MSRKQIPLEDVILLSNYVKHKFPLSSEEMKIFNTIDCKKIIKSIIHRFYVPNQLVFYYGGIDQQDVENIIKYYALVYIAAHKDTANKSYFSFMYSFIIQRMIVLYKSLYRRVSFYIYNYNQDYEYSQYYLSNIHDDNDNYEDMLIELLDKYHQYDQEQFINWLDQQLQDKNIKKHKKLHEKLKNCKKYLRKNIDQFKDILLQYTQSDNKEFRDISLYFCKKYKII